MIKKIKKVLGVVKKILVLPKTGIFKHLITPIFDILNV